MGKKTPELSNPPSIFYNAVGSEKYHRNTRINKVQTEIAERCIELLNAEKSHSNIVLDIGCGSGISIKVINNELNNPFVIGIDISIHMLNLVDCCYNLIQGDIGYSWPFSDNSVDYAVSCSVIQWLFQSYSKCDIPHIRIHCFFKELYRVIKFKSVLQFYAGKTETQIFIKEAKKVGFKGGVQIDNENTRREKKYLILYK